ncbi:helix-turn-helix transcriptional regulator [Phenylobacterium sp. VNQ135]|uniref:helix-turn-helix transcriptional regulator n=1 Tax=Phenylobacterium sp. VNQ135 TaxID=3400922 RepID=UPI003C126EB5
MSIHFPRPAMAGSTAWTQLAAAFESAPHEPNGWAEALEVLMEATGLRAARVLALQAGDRWAIAERGSAGDLPHKLLLSLVRDPLPEVQITVAGAPAAVERAGAALAALASVIGQAARTQFTVEAEAIRLAIAMLRRAGLQPLVCGPDGALLHEGGPQVLRDGPLRVANGRVCAAPADEAALRAALRDAVVLGRDHVLLLGRDSEAPAVVDVLPALTGAARALRPHALVLLRGRTTDARERAPILKQLYGLTTAEASVALAVTQGTPLGEIAVRRGVAASTVRAQVKTILAKVGVGRQVELVHRLAAVC